MRRSSLTIEHECLSVFSLYSYCVISVRLNFQWLCIFDLLENKEVFAIDMCVGSLILFIWQRIDKVNADTFGSAVASGLICGDGIWTLPSSFLALAGVKPPICMKFLSRGVNTKVDGFLES